jgi:hypothetical protein
MTTTHEPRVCTGARPADGNSWFSEDGRVFWPGRSTAAHSGYWSVNLRCPDCGREARFNENYLGGKPVLCNGAKFLRPHQYDLATLVHAMHQAQEA